MSAGPGSSIIVGLGLTETGFPSYGVFGGFADLVWPGGRVSLRYTGVEYTSALRFAILDGASDGGRVHAFNVTRDQWTNYTDERGTVLIPLQQNLHLQSDRAEFKASCEITLARTNRLLFPYQDLVFSDFETLGATCSFSLVFDGETVLSGIDTSSGVEYGRA